MTNTPPRRSGTLSLPGRPASGRVAPRPVPSWARACIFAGNQVRLPSGRVGTVVRWVGVGTTERAGIPVDIEIEISFDGGAPLRFSEAFAARLTKVEG